MSKNENLPKIPNPDRLSAMTAQDKADAAATILENATNAQWEMHEDDADAIVTILTRTYNERSLFDVVRELARQVETVHPDFSDRRSYPALLTAVTEGLLFGGPKLSSSAAIFATELVETSAHYSRETHDTLCTALHIDTGPGSDSVAEQLVKIYVYPDASLADQKGVAAMITEMADRRVNEQIPAAPQA